MILATTLLLLIAIQQAKALSCSLGRAGCVSSCMAQNCATGYCRGDTCVCSRCNNGPVRF